jgi:ABC-type nitrate/sulfonate/bicarbonate transport system substrate-binding protein
MLQLFLRRMFEPESSAGRTTLCRSAGRFHFLRGWRTRKSHICWGIALALAAATCTAQELTIAVSRTPLSLPVFVAESQKYFADEGVAVTTRECIGGNRCIKLMLDGEVPLATASEMPVMFNSLARSDFAIIATFVTSRRDVKLIARKSAGIATAADLSGKRVGTVKGTSAHFFLDLYLLFNAVDPQGVTLVPLAPELIAAALKDGTVDAAAIWEPFANKSMRALGADGIVMPSARLYTSTFNLLASRKLIAERDADLVKVLRALVRAQRFIHERPQQAQAILMQRLQEDQAYIDATWNDYDFRMSLDQPLVSTLEGQARWAVREGHAPRDSRIPNYLQLLAPEPLRRADPGAVTLVK